MKWTFALLMLALLAATCMANTALPDRYFTRTNSTTGLMDPMELVSAASKHVFVFFTSGSGANIANTTFTTLKACDNSTQSIGNCASNTSTVDGEYFVINESASLTTSYNATINITNNATLNTSTSSFDLIVYGGHFAGYTTHVNMSRSCNHTNAQNTTTSSGTCAATAAIGGSNYTINENSSYNQAYAAYINITNVSFGVSGGVFSITVAAGYFGDTVPVTIDILNNDSSWINLGRVNVNSMDTVTFSGLSPTVYAASNITQIRFNHANAGDNTTNATLVIDAVYANLTYANSASGNVSIGLYNGSDYVTVGYLPTDSFGWVNVTGINATTYAPTLNRTQIIFLHSNNGTNNSEGIKLDYVALRSHVESTVTTTASIGIEGSIDNTHWFNYGNFTGATTPATLLLTNMTVPYVRLNVTALSIGNDPSNSFTINYLGVY